MLGRRARYTGDRRSVPPGGSRGRADADPAGCGGRRTARAARRLQPVPGLAVGPSGPPAVTIRAAGRSAPVPGVLRSRRRPGRGRRAQRDGCRCGSAPGHHRTDQWSVRGHGRRPLGSGAPDATRPCAVGRRRGQRRPADGHRRRSSGGRALRRGVGIGRRRVPALRHAGGHGHGRPAPGVTGGALRPHGRRSTPSAGQHRSGLLEPGFRPPPQHGQPAAERPAGGDHGRDERCGHRPRGAPGRPAGPVTGEEGTTR